MSVIGRRNFNCKVVSILDSDEALYILLCLRVHIYIAPLRDKPLNVDNSRLEKYSTG